MSLNQFDQVADIIRALEPTESGWPGLGELAQQAGMSPSHFQKVFTNWVGISPKRFLQGLTQQALLARLRQGATVEMAAQDAGLSGSGRAHDLLIQTVAVTPGMVRQGGAGLVIRHGVGLSPFGWTWVAGHDGGIMAMAFLTSPDDALAEQALLQSDWPKAVRIVDDLWVQSILDIVFGATRPDRPLALWLKGTNFQLQVWQALLDVAPSEVVSYGQLAERIGRPGAARAVGTAVASNAIAWLIPCHRVIRESGVLGEYRWGRARKRLMLGWEAARHTVGD